MFLTVNLGSSEFNITIDGGATVSFIKLELALALRLDIQPNGNLARLADKRHSSQSKGEVDFCVTEVTTKAQLRIRALLMEHLAVDCYGGTTFKFDNYVVTNFVTSTVFMHGGQFKVTRPPKQPYTRYPPPSLLAKPSTGPPSPTETSSNKERPSSACSAPQSRVMRHAKNLLPHGSYSIPLPNMTCSAVLVCPPTPSPGDPPEMCWPPQVCTVEAGSAIYTNQTENALCHPKGVHFRLVPLSENVPPTLPLTL